jgi:hypothetical protein
MRVAIMQPYLLPYIGYFQLIMNSDVFVLADEYQFTKKGWINRNRAILNDKLETFTVPVSTAGYQIRDKKISSTDSNRSLYRKIKQSYRKAPNAHIFDTALKEILESEEEFLVNFIEQSINSICQCLDIDTRIVRLSELDNNKKLTGVERVLDISQTLGATTYLNPEGGKGIYASQVFEEKGIQLEFLESSPKPYPQTIPGFLDRLSVIDLLYMVGSLDDLHGHLNSFQILKSLE